MGTLNKYSWFKMNDQQFVAFADDYIGSPIVCYPVDFVVCSSGMMEKVVKNEWMSRDVINNCKFLLT